MKFLQIFLALGLLVVGFLLGTNFSFADQGPSSDDTIIENASEQTQVMSYGKSAKDSNTTDNSNSQLTAEENAVINLFEDAAPSVVFITTTAIQQASYFYDATEVPKGSGTGFMWDENGHIVTNFHVIEGGDKFSVMLSDQTSYNAEVIGVEPSKDLAVLRIDAPNSKIKPLPIGRSGNLKVGQSTYAIGNPFGFDQTLTTGVVSALGREITAMNGRKIYDVIQTDAAINPGNSGGPLLNSSGRLIGVNTAIYSPSGAYSGIGFSIPVDIVNLIVPDLIQYGRVNRPIMGVELMNENYVDVDGAMIKRVFENTPADRAGLKGLSRTSRGYLPGDVIKAVDGQRISSNADLQEALEKYKPQDIVTFLIESDQDMKEVKLKLISSVE